MHCIPFTFSTACLPYILFSFQWSFIMLNTINQPHKCYKTTTCAIARPKNGGDTVTFKAFNMCCSTTPGCCARESAGCKSGENYALCAADGLHIHAEEMLPIKIAEHYAPKMFYAVEEAIFSMAKKRSEGIDVIPEQDFPSGLKNIFEKHQFTVTLDGHVAPCELCHAVLQFFGIYDVFYTGFPAMPKSVEDMQSLAQKHGRLFDLRKTSPKQTAELLPILVEEALQ
jgi:hypothetical protein